MESFRLLLFSKVEFEPFFKNAKKNNTLSYQKTIEFMILGWFIIDFTLKMSFKKQNFARLNEAASARAAACLLCWNREKADVPFLTDSDQSTEQAHLSCLLGNLGGASSVKYNLPCKSKQGLQVVGESAQSQTFLKYSIKNGGVCHRHNYNRNYKI